MKLTAMMLLTEITKKYKISFVSNDGKAWGVRTLHACLYV